MKPMLRGQWWCLGWWKIIGQVQKIQGQVWICSSYELCSVTQWWPIIYMYIQCTSAHGPSRYTNSIHTLSIYAYHTHSHSYSTIIVLGHDRNPSQTIISWIFNQGHALHTVRTNIADSNLLPSDRHNQLLTLSGHHDWTKKMNPTAGQLHVGFGNHE